MKKINLIIVRYWQMFFLILFMLAAAILRFSNITKLQFFTYDQSRDALFVKRMIVDHQFRLLGTQTSLPGMYLPPFYFYTITPVLWLFGLNPVGIDIYSATIGVLTIPLLYFVGNKIFGKPAGLFSAGLFAVSPIVVELTRRAWNPNTLPFYILITFYFLYQYFKEEKVKDFFLAFGFYGYCLSLHFGAWTLMPLFIFSWFYFFFKSKKNRLKGCLGSLLLMALFVLPLLLFEIRHNFFLSSQAKIFFFDGGHVGPGSRNLGESFLASLLAIFTILISGKIMIGYGAPLEFSAKLKDLILNSQPVSVVAQKPFSLSFQWWGAVIFFLIVLASGYSIFKKKFPLSALVLWVWVLWGVFASLLYSGKFFFFYYLFLFPAPVLLLGFLAQRAWSIKVLRPVVFLALLAICYFHLKYTTVFAQGWRDFSDLKKTATLISENVLANETFNIATIQRDRDRWDRNAVDYRYFVEAYGQKRAFDWYPEDYQKAKFLFVVDETGKGDVLNSNIMEIQEFKPGKIIGQWATDKGVVIYKISKKEK